jgi:hypothetical protein
MEIYISVVGKFWFSNKSVYNKIYITLNHNLNSSYTLSAINQILVNFNPKYFCITLIYHFDSILLNRDIS